MKKKVPNEMLGVNDYSVVSSLSISLDKIAVESEAALSVLLLLGFLSPDGITKKLVKLLLEVIYFKTEFITNEILNDDKNKNENENENEIKNEDEKNYYHDNKNVVNNKSNVDDSKMKLPKILQIENKCYDGSVLEHSNSVIKNNFMNAKNLLGEHSSLLISNPVININVEREVKNRKLEKKGEIREKGDTKESKKIKMTNKNEDRFFQNTRLSST